MAFVRVTRGQNSWAETAETSRTIFDEIDVDHSGELDYEEVKEMCKRLGRDLDDTDFQVAMEQMDSDGDGNVSFTEFDRWWQKYGIERQLVMAETRLKEARAAAWKVFQEVDADGNGTLDEAEVHQMFNRLGRRLAGEKFEEAMAQMDSDGDGQVTFDEFEKWWRKFEIQKELRKADLVTLLALQITTHL